MTGTLAEPLARALNEHTEAQVEFAAVHCHSNDECDKDVFARLRSDPAVLTAMAEALHATQDKFGMGIGCLYFGGPECLRNHAEDAARLLDALLGEAVVPPND